MDDLQAELAQLKAENERLKKQQASPLRLKVSAKGALSVYGLGHFPVTLYKEQWARLLDLRFSPTLAPLTHADLRVDTEMV